LSINEGFKQFAKEMIFNFPTSNPVASINMIGML